jgi:tRNA threonylcarbamoyl adenosine modification protein (Sua5/YciO/YrdC/YwlC family)
MAKLIKLYEENPSPKHVKTIVDCLMNDGIVVFPTDTVYKGLERMARTKGQKADKMDFSLIFDDLSHLSDYTLPLTNSAFKTLKRCLPGPFTFILDANSNVPKIFKRNKKSIGIRIPENDIARLLVEELGHPLVTTSIRDEDRVREYTTDPELIAERYGEQVDIVIDAGFSELDASTVVDLREEPYSILREGKGDITLL